MRASKESAREAMKALEDIEGICGGKPMNASDAKLFGCSVAWLGEFIRVAQRKLPTEAAFDRDANRRAKKAKR